MLQLYFSPLACSLSSRIALMEAGLQARYHQVHLLTKTRVEDDGDFRAVAPKGAPASRPSLNGRGDAAVRPF